MNSRERELVSDGLEKFENQARAFYANTGIYAPGKDISAAANGSPIEQSTEFRLTLWHLYWKLRNRFDKELATRDKIIGKLEADLDIADEKLSRYIIENEND